MDTWDWRAWTVAVLVVGVVGWLLWRWVAGLAFRHLLLGGVLRRHGWHADLPGGDGGRAAFAARERQRRRQAWALLRRGRIREGYRNGVFGRSQSGSWHAELTVTGAWRGRSFVASQARRYELTSSSEGTRRKIRRRASLQVAGAFPVFEARVGLFGRVSGAPPALVALVRARRFRFRGFRSDGSGLSVSLGPRLRRGRLLAALEYLSDAADRLR